MTLTIYLPSKNFTLQHFTTWYPTIVDLTAEKGIELIAGIWAFPRDVMERQPGIVYYSSIISSTDNSALRMARVCERYGHLCLYNDAIIFAEREPLKGDAMREFAANWLDRLKVTA